MHACTLFTMTVTPCSLKSMATPPSSTVSSRHSRDRQPPAAEERHQQCMMIYVPDKPKIMKMTYQLIIILALEHTYLFYNTLCTSGKRQRSTAMKSVQPYQLHQPPSGKEVILCLIWWHTAGQHTLNIELGKLL